MGQYLATKKRGSRAARVVAKILGADVDAINRDFVLSKLKEREYLESIREKVLNVLKTKLIDEFAASLDPPPSPGEAWEVFRQIKDVILDAEIIGTISQVSNQISSLLPTLRSEALSLRTTIEEQIKEVKHSHDQLEGNLYQSYGLNWLASDYFEKHSVQEEQELQVWKEGFPFKLESIYKKLECRLDIVAKIEAYISYSTNANDFAF